MRAMSELLLRTDPEPGALTAREQHPPLPHLHLQAKDQQHHQHVLEGSGVRQRLRAILRKLLPVAYRLGPILLPTPTGKPWEREEEDRTSGGDVGLLPQLCLKRTLDRPSRVPFPLCSVGNNLHKLAPWSPWKLELTQPLKMS